MEDDVLFNDDMIIIIDYYLYRLGLGGGYLFKYNIIFIKFYYLDRFLGFISLERERLLELFCLGLILIICFVKVYLIIYLVEVKYRKIIWLGFFVYFCILVLVVGR